LKLPRSLSPPSPPSLKPSANTKINSPPALMSFRFVCAFLNGIAVCLSVRSFRYSLSTSSSPLTFSLCLSRSIFLLA
jgi:hypothetical protein